MIDTDKVSEFIITAGRLNEALKELRTALQELETGKALIDMSILRGRTKHDIYSLKTVDRKELEIEIKQVIINHLKDKEKFVESELQNLLAKQLEGGNE
ncbi:hypothetical protein CUC43_25990 [Bacillus thuringiensis LM1212]|uniref:hypothetical protein n=1 Tax=Bacillus cereus group TaxID=86661 RepID=UPI0004183C5B|nr:MULTISPECIES: hypothetical protein [Bacillus cereus group]AXY09987.1 hypothetical protein CUC43_25990 [Bacillus thuringiensis LM1212]QDF22888.1 hypothetical protein FJR70_07560 [Bacillus tropicus]QUG96210.1 hypothetical protein HCM98_15245 [Bacillus tropicus]